MLFPEQTADLLARCNFPPAGSALDCAVSGGVDSLTLMALAVAHGCEVTAFHVDHRLREESGLEPAIVAEAAAQIGAKFVALRVDCPKGPNLEARARALRYGVLPPNVATGHTADDQVETMLLNLLRGAGRDGLSAMTHDYRHPILALRRADTEAFAAALGVEIVHDRSNEDLAFLRNRVRHELLPLLNEIAARDLVPVLYRQGELMHDESVLLDELASALDPTDVHQLQAAPIPLVRRALRWWIREHTPSGYSPDSGATERVIRVIRGEVVACETAGGLRIRRSKGRLILESPINQDQPQKRVTDDD